MAITHNFKTPVFNFRPTSQYHSPPNSSTPLFVFKTPQISHSPFPIIPSVSFNSQPTASLTSNLISRRLFLPSVSGLWDAITGANNSRETVLAIRRGMLLFRQRWDFLTPAYVPTFSFPFKGDVSGSMLEFDKAIELDPRQKAYLWQRGLSLYYLDRFEEGAEQFRIDVAQNPNDTEESIWCFLCESQLFGVDEARRRFLQASCYPPRFLNVGRDPRPVMREAYNMFKDGGDPEKLVAAFSNGPDGEYFYASLYAGLYYESEKKPDNAKHHILAASQSPYGQRSDDYMAALAKVHCLCRAWIPESNI
ncbi:hypothetical protein RJ641_023705 [Dillenia turbinata]|uniref:Uncharacterized protein n=1 Tax=Dillenia turbinata TaxID=194707 RepID=A0AAN8YT15_9MAGN